MQQYIDDSERDEIFKGLKNDIHNKKCMDCNKKNPTWASVYLGLLLCYDCSGKHRQYGVMYTFVRSLDLDKWNRRQITFMQIGGNAKATEYFAKHGLTAPYDYKSPIVDKYKKEQTKKADEILGNISNEPVTKAAEKPAITTSKSDEVVAAKPTVMISEPEKVEEIDPFKNVTVSKQTTKTKVEFNKAKTSGAAKGRMAAKKIENIDLDSLSLQEDTNSWKPERTSVDTMDSFGALDSNRSKEAEVKEVVQTISKPEVSDSEKFKQFKNAKSISSSSFANNDGEGFGSDSRAKFANASAISSSQYFGDSQGGSGADYHQTVDNAKEFISNVGDKLKEKAGTLGVMGYSMFNKINNSETVGNLGSMFSKISSKWTAPADGVSAQN